MFVSADVTDRAQCHASDDSLCTTVASALPANLYLLQLLCLCWLGLGPG